jgi:UDP-N-acetylglucosamine 4,6-dehydratase
MFVNQRSTGVVTVTDPRMTRFWITSDEGVSFVIQCIEKMEGGEVFVPKAPSAGVMDLVETIAPDCRIDYIGIREGEKLHEVLIAEDEARRARELEDMFVIWPTHSPTVDGPRPGRPLPDGYQYTSDGTARRLTCKELLDRLVQAGDLPEN